jgi:hypothetical protein
MQERCEICQEQREEGKRLVELTSLGTSERMPKSFTHKWWKADSDVDLFRGVKRARKGKDKNVGSNYNRLEEALERSSLVDPKERGDGLIINGT